jgi:Predicted xylanase/chitin deacetylase
VLLAAAVVLAAGPSSARAVSPNDAENPLCVPILMYHEVKYDNPGKDSILPYELEGDLKYLKSSGYHAVTMNQLIDYVYRGTPLPEKPVILSFDDGYLSTYVFVRPLLQKYGERIVLSIIGKSTDDFSQKPSTDITTHMTWNQINEMKDAGLAEIQNHTYNMHKITHRRYGCGRKRGETQQDYICALSEDISRLQAEVKQHTGAAPTTFTYPYGQVSDDSVPIIKGLGFKASLTCKYGINLITKDPDVLFGLRRICRSHGVTAKRTLDEAMETLRFRKGYHMEKEGNRN